MIAAGRMRETIHAAHLVNKSSSFDERITISIGLSASQPWLTINETALIDSADQALYEAKHSGRNRICSRPCQPLISTVEMPPVLG